MKRNVVESLLGALVLLVAVGFFVWAYARADVGDPGGNVLSAKFDRVDGLDVGGVVRISGIRVGQVLEQRLDPVSFRAEVRFSVERSVELPADSTAAVVSSGLLGGKYGVDNRPGGVRALNSLFGTENLRRIEPLLQTLRDVAAEVDAKPAQVALAWLTSLPGVVAIPGASSVEQLEFNVAAADIELSAESRDALTAAARAFRPASAGRFLTDLVRERLGR